MRINGRSSRPRERGQALLGTIVIGLVFMTLMVWYLQWSWVNGEEEAHRMAGQLALSYADSGLNAAMQRLKMPQNNPDFSVIMASNSLAEGRYEYSLSFDSTTPSLVDAWATGYYFLAKGGRLDELTGRQAQRAVLHAKVITGALNAFLLAVPGQLKINTGMVAMGGPIYGGDVTFVQGGDRMQAMVNAVIYSRTVTDQDGNSAPAPSYVVFQSSPPTAQQLSYPPQFPRPGLALRDYYKAKAADFTTQLDDGSDLSGNLPRAGDPVNPVYFCDGNLDIGRNGPLTVNEPVIIYVTGQLTIHNWIAHQDQGWAAVLVEKDATISADAQDPLTLQGTFLIGGAFRSDGSPRLPGRFQLAGTIIAGSGIDLAANWAVRRYFWAAGSAQDLPLFSQILEYDVVEGKYH